MNKRKFGVALLVLGVFSFGLVCSKSDDILQHFKKELAEKRNKILGSLLGCAVGDALGRIPELYWMQGGALDKSPRAEYMRLQWRKDFPKGITSFSDFRKKDFIGGKAVYTDDTQMSLLVTEALLEYEEWYWGRRTDPTMGPLAPSTIRGHANAIMSRIAGSFSEWLVDPNGGQCGFRAPGIGCRRAARRIRDYLRGDLAKQKWGEFLPGNWWAQGEGGSLKPLTEGGCGSVMRVFPFALFYRGDVCGGDIEKVVYFAERHSCLTHRAPIARAACAAMAEAVVRALDGKSPNVILQGMVNTARRFDAGTADMIEKAWDYAKTKPSDAHIRDYLEKLDGRLGSQSVAATAFVFACEHEDLLRGLKLAINFYGDADSVGAMVGALLGAYLGAKTFFKKENYKNYLEPLEDRDRFIELAGKIACCGPDGRIAKF